MRPEAADGGYDAHQVDQAAVDDFVPWRSGDPSTAGEAPAVPADTGRTFEGSWARLLGQSERSEPAKKDAEQAADKPRGRWWTEDAPQRYNVGDAVRAKEAIAGEFGMRHVPAGTRGRVVDKQMGVLSGEFLTVEFENGYTEPLDAKSLKRDSWF